MWVCFLQIYIIHSSKSYVKIRHYYPRDPSCRAQAYSRFLQTLPERVFGLRPIGHDGCQQLHPTFHVPLLEPHYGRQGEVRNSPEIPIDGEDTPELNEAFFLCLGAK